MLSPISQTYELRLTNVRIGSLLADLTAISVMTAAAAAHLVATDEARAVVVRYVKRVKEALDLIRSGGRGNIAPPDLSLLQSASDVIVDNEATHIMIQPIGDNNTIVYIDARTAKTIESFLKGLPVKSRPSPTTRRVQSQRKNNPPWTYPLQTEDVNRPHTFDAYPNRLGSSWVIDFESGRTFLAIGDAQAEQLREGGKYRFTGFLEAAGEEPERFRVEKLRRLQ